tara:strand:+ start:1856 stop:2260 length:405 start_codon:yes stop_codon:yes gene_type:complete
MSNGPKKPTPSGPSLDQLLMKSMSGNQPIKRAADTSAVDTRVMQERQPPDDFQKRFDALYEKRRQEDLTALQEPKRVQQGALRAGQQSTTVRPPPKPITKKFSTKIPVSKTTTLEPVRMGEGLGGGLKATVKFK